jgi:hypothetical protein
MGKTGCCGPLLPRPGGAHPAVQAVVQQYNKFNSVSACCRMWLALAGPVARCCHHGLVRDHPAVQAVTT